MSVLLKSLPLMIAGVLASGALAACGGSGSNANASTQDNERQVLNFVRCMREHGVNISQQGTGGGPFKVTGTNPAVMEAAQKACQRYRPQGRKENLSPAERAARADAISKFAKCMREHGIELQTQTSGSGAIGIELHDQNPENPAFQAAQKSCEGFLPFRPGRTLGPKPGSGGSSTETSGSASGSSAGGSLSLGAGK
jgi:hypothetical protein